MPVANGYDLPFIRLAFQMKSLSPDLMVILPFGTALPTHALVLVDAVVAKLAANRQLLPVITALCRQTGEER